MPLFSIIIPVYKVEKYLHKCVDSVLSQDFQDFEIILVDDGSPDTCPQICDELAANDTRIKVIHKINGGLSDARNTGVLASKGQYLLFLDSDDYWLINSFLNSLSKIILNDNQIDIINFGWTKFYEDSNQYIPDNRNFNITKENFQNDQEYIDELISNDLFIASACNKCIRRDFLTHNQIYFVKGLLSEDMDWCGKILFSLPVMTCLDEKPYAYLQQRFGSITSNVSEQHLNDIVGMINVAINDSEKLETKLKFSYLSFFAVQYLTLIFNFRNLEDQIPKDLSYEINKLKFILKYDLNRKVKIVNIFIKILGFKITSKILQLFVLKSRK